MSKIRCLKKVFLMVAAGFLVAGCSNLSGAGNENLNQNPQKGGTKVFTVSGTIGFNGAVPSEIKEKFFDDTNQNDGTSKAAYASVPTEDITIKVWAENENPEISKLDAVISANKKTFTISLTEGNWKFFGQFFDGDGNLIMTYSDKNFVPINEDNESYSPVIKLAPSKNGTGYVKLEINADPDLYDSVSCKFNGNEYTKDVSTGGTLYFTGTGFAENYVPSAVAAGSYETVFYFWKNDVIAYQILQTINVYNNMTTDSWIGNEKYFQSGKIELDEEMLKKFVLTNIYVGSGSGKGNGTYYEPYTDLKYAFDSIKANAEIVKEYIEDDPGYGWYESEFHIWIKDTVNQKKNIDFEMFSNEMDNFVSVYVYVSSNDDQIKRIDCSGCSKESDFLKLSSDVLNINFSNLNFYNCRKGICADCGGLEINNCTFTGSDTTIQKYAVKLCYVASGDYGTFLNMSGKTYFEKNYPIYIEHNCVVYLTESFDFSRNDLIANIKVAQGTETNPGEYSAAVPNVLLNESIISSYSAVEEQFKAALSKFKILNFWYDFEYDYDDSSLYYKLVPCFHVAPSVTTDGSPCGSESGNGSEYSPLDINTAIKMYNYFVSDEMSDMGIYYSSFTTTISFAEGEFEAPELSSDGIVKRYSLLIKGQGRRDSVNGTGTLIKTAFTDIPFIKSGQYQSMVDNSITIQDLSVKYTGTEPINSNGFISVSSRHHVFLQNVEISNFLMGEEDCVVINSCDANLNFKDVYIHDCKRVTSRNSCNGCVIYIEKDSYSPELSFENVTIENCKIESTDNADEYDLNGAAVYYSGDVFNLKGKNSIYSNKITFNSKSLHSNIYLAKQNNNVSKLITVEGSLAGSKIGVSTELVPSLSVPIKFTSEYGSNNKDSNNKVISPDTFFFGDIYGIAEGSGSNAGEVCLKAGGGYVKAKDSNIDLKIELSCVEDNGDVLVTPSVKVKNSSGTYDTVDSDEISNIGFEVSSYSNSGVTCDTTTNPGQLIMKPSPSTSKAYNYYVSVHFKYNGAYYGTTKVVNLNSAELLSETPVSGSVINIANIDDVKKIAAIIGTGSNPYFEGVTLLQIADIILDPDEKNNWPRIGNASTPFSGTYDGNGKKITGLYIFSENDWDNYHGLFDYAKNAVLKNIDVEGKMELFCYASNVASVCGYLDGGEINNCTSNVNIANSYLNSQFTGGIAGQISNNAIINGCTNKGQIKSRKSSGGITGQIGQNCNVINCANLGDLILPGPYANGTNRGGIAGKNSGKIANCYSDCMMNVTVDTSSASANACSKVGGLSGINEGTISNCCSYIKFILSKSNANTYYLSNIGNIAGYASADEIENCYYSVYANTGEEGFYSCSCIINKQTTSINGATSFTIGSNSRTSSDVTVGLKTTKDVYELLNAWIYIQCDGNTYKNWKNVSNKCPVFDE